VEARIPNVAGRLLMRRDSPEVPIHAQHDLQGCESRQDYGAQRNGRTNRRGEPAREYRGGGDRDHWEKNQEVAPLDSLDAVSVKWGPDDVEDGEYDEHVSNRQAEVEKRNTQADSRIEVESIPTRLKQSGIRKWGGTWRRAGVVGCSFSWTRAKRQPR